MITETVDLYSPGGMSIPDLVDRSDKKLTEHSLENGLRFHMSVSAALLQLRGVASVLKVTG